VDSICTFCEKGCNTTAWLKAKPEWAKGARLARITPRYNPDVNDYWMCDIGRFDYHWIEGDDRLRRAGTKFKIPPIDAPNVKGAQDLGFPARATAAGAPELDAFRRQVEGGGVKALYVFDPGPEGSIGDVAWVIDARRSGKLPLLIVHGVLLTDLARAADVVLPGACSYEKDAAYVNQQGRLQAAARALSPPGDAQEDWQIFVNLALTLQTRLDYTSGADVRADVARAMASDAAYAAITDLAFARPVTAKHWLQASNPSERWKWDVMFQDLPPVKFAGRPDPTSIPSAAIRLQKID
jgi:predicted molibdopterin-dependent oxidoreductase YjgC